MRKFNLMICENSINFYGCNLMSLRKILMELNDLRKILMAIKTSDQRLHVRFDARWREDIIELWYSIDTEWKLWCCYVHTLEFLNTINARGLPHHKIRLKIGVPIML